MNLNKIFTMWNNSNGRSSDDNYRAVEVNGFTPNERMHLGNNIWVLVQPRKGEIRKFYFWGKKEIKQQTAMKRLGIEA